MSKFYITTPIYYVNDVPHIGSAYTTVAADVLSRLNRRLGNDTYFLTGTDEHGTKIAEAAAQRNVTPQEFTDEIVGAFKESWRLLNISNDQFIRTSDPDHERGVQAFLARLYERGQIYKGRYEGLYCVGCEAYYQPEDLVDGLCPIHRRPPITYSEDNYFFKLSEYQNVLINAITDPNDPNHYEVQPDGRRNEVLGKLRLGLNDLSISRANLDWGIPLPFDSSHTCYVWVDALLNYATAVGLGRDDAQFNRYWPADIHLIGKDILWFHAVIWPAMLIAGGLQPPRQVFAHGFFTVGGQKMSKSIGNVIRPAELVEQFGVDAARYLLLSEFPFGTDGDVSIPSFTARYNAELANDLGNLLNRSVSMINRYCGGLVPAAGTADPLDAELVAAAEKAVESLKAHLQRLEFDGATAAVRGLVTRANRYIEETQPWKLAKSDQARLATVLRNLVEAQRIAAELLWPFMPEACERLADQLGVPLGLGGGWSAQGLCWGQVPENTKVTEKPSPLFPKIE